MGSWGAGSFQNDAALDWLVELRERGAAAVRETLDLAANAPRGAGFDVDEGEWTFAAAEIVAAARGHAARYLPDEARAFLDEHAGLFTANDAKLARAAIERITTDPLSELRSLRAAPVVNEQWRSSVDDLLQRLAQGA